MKREPAILDILDRLHVLKAESPLMDRDSLFSGGTCQSFGALMQKNAGEFRYASDATLS